MQDILTQLFGYLWGIWRYRWAALFLAWALAIGGWIWVYQTPEQYVASARVHVDTNSILGPLLRGLAIRPDINQRIELMSRTLLSRPNLEKLMRMTDLDLQAQTDKQKELILEQLLENIELSGSRQNASLYTVSFHHPDRDLAKRMVQSLLTVFIETTLGEERQDNAGAQNFLDQQIAEYEKRLIEAEARLANFKQKYVGILPGQAGGYYARLESSREQLKAAQLNLNEMVNRRDELKRQLAGEEPVFLSMGSGVQTSSLDGRIQALESRLDDLLSRYTERYPEVVQIRDLIAELEAERDKEISSNFAGQIADFSGLQSSPVYQQMRSMLTQAEANIAELNVRVAEFESRVKELEDMVDNIPVIEAELKQLNRDYEVVSHQHSELLQRRESARISEDVEHKANDLVFRVIDPPFVPRKPNEPDKLLLNSAVFVAALGLGGGFAFLLSLLNPVVIDRRSLGMTTGLPVLGSVSYVQNSMEKRQATLRSLQFIALFVLLLAVFIALNIVQQWLIK